MSNKMEELRRINAEKKELLEKQRKLREELEATKDERKSARATMANSRKMVREHKSNLRDIMASIFEKFSEGDSDTINELADDIMENATELATAVREFANTCNSLEEL